ncbi:LysR family transcriptional regulator [Cronobacter dublinensis]|uniref:LysR family transcriptional regulator n=1 Tax=Cronobacter dublinensis TaxID=413497 RepID=UPI000CFF363B|nr:LysR family transcriptional regulator [Cronobacter dublinensis]
MDSLTALTSFVRTAETLSFTEAARLLGISASAVGKNVARLEQRLGVRLFNRSTRSVSLTSEGERLLARCRPALEQLRDAEAELTSSQQRPSGRLRVSLPAIGYHLLMPFFPAFAARYPEIEIELDFSDRLVNLVEEGFDVAIRSGEIADSRLTARTLGHFRFVLCASPAYLAAQGAPASPEALKQHRVILFRFPSTGLIQPWALRGFQLTGAHQAHAALTVNNIEAMIRAAAAGLGICYVPDFIVNSMLARGELCEVMPGYCERTGAFSALWPTSRYLSPRVRCFIDFLKAHWGSPQNTEMPGGPR